MQLKNISLIAVICLCLSSNAAHAQVSREKWRGGFPISVLLDLWNSGNPQKVGIAYGYLLGTVDGMRGDAPVCVPIEPEWSVIFKRVIQEMDAVKNNLQKAGKDPESIPANLLVEAAFRRAYPCGAPK